MQRSGPTSRSATLSYLDREVYRKSETTQGSKTGFVAFLLPHQANFKQ